MRVVQHIAGPSGAWDVAFAQPHTKLRSAVRAYEGFRKDQDAMNWQAFLGSGVNLVLGFDVEQPQRFILRADGTTVTPYTSLLSGVSTRSCRWLDYGGRARGLSVVLTPWAAFTMFGVDMHDLAERVIDPADLLGDRVHALLDTLAATSGQEQRFEVLDDVLSRWLADGHAWSPRVAWAYDRLSRCGGALPIRTLAAEVGWRPRQLEYRFREQIGVPLKVMAGIFRLQRATVLLTMGWTAARVAAACAFTDQAHMTREFASLAGRTPARVGANFRTRPYMQARLRHSPCTLRIMWILPLL